MSDREPKCPGHPYGLMRVNTATGETTCDTCGGYMFTARLKSTGSVDGEGDSDE